MIKRRKKENGRKKEDVFTSQFMIHNSQFILLLLLSACSFAQPLKAQPSADIYPVETAREDGDWTLLYRDVPLAISEDGFVIFLIPSDWTPAGLTDNDHLKFSSVITKDKAILTFERFRP